MKVLEHSRTQVHENTEWITLGLWVVAEVTDRTDTQELKYSKFEVLIENSRIRLDISFDLKQKTCYWYKISSMKACAKAKGKLKRIVF